MSANSKDQKELLFSGSLSFLNHIIRVIYHNYFLCVWIVTGSFALGVMDSYTGIGGALGAGIAYGLIQRKKRGFIRGFLIGASFVLVAVCWGQYQGYTNAQKTNAFETSNITLSLEDQLSEVANALQKKLPITVDESTIMTDIKAEGTLLIQTLVFTSHNFDQINVMKLSGAMRPFVISALCTKHDTKELLELGVSYELKYYSKDQKFLFDINIDAERCSGFD